MTIRAVVTGGSGFVGSHLCERLVYEGWNVVCFDSLITGDTANLAGLEGHERFHFERCDVADGLSAHGAVDWILHLASPASPVDYLAHPIETLRAGADGTMRALRLAREKSAAFLLASTSEVYGDPAVHPQPESYWGNVNPVGPRSVYDEAKRYAEALTMAFHRTYGIAVKIPRIFNTYGPRLRREDGRAVPTFIWEALRGEPLTIYGDGSQTRSFCHVDDLVEGLWRILNSDLTGPVNLGNPEELTILELAELVRELVGGPSEVRFVERMPDDPTVRRPDITLIRSATGWEPKVPLRDGLIRTIEWARKTWLAG